MNDEKFSKIITILRNHIEADKRRLAALEFKINEVLSPAPDCGAGTGSGDVQVCVDEGEAKKDLGAG